MTETDILIKALHDCQSVVRSRFKKEADCPSGGEYSLGYSACAKEIDTRIQEIITEMSDKL